MTRADRAIRGTAGSAVAALAVIAGAVSYAHMRVLADQHGETGWRGHAFPLSVDGIEIVASLVLLADRRVGRRSGWLVWASLAAGTAASMAANVAVGASDPIGRVVAGWPAFALLLAIKLLSGLMDHHVAEPPSDLPSEVAKATGSVGPSDDLHRRGPSDGSARVGVGRPARTRGRSSAVTDLLPAALAVRDSVVADGGKFTRTVLADRLREQGHTVANARLTELLREVAAQPIGVTNNVGGDDR
jgi:hypothetical protein